MNNPIAQPLSGIPPAPQKAPKSPQDICARLDAILAALLLWATRLPFLGRRIAPHVNALAAALRALSALFARLAAGVLPLAPTPRAAAPSNPPPSAPAANRARPVATAPIHHRAPTPQPPQTPNPPFPRALQAARTASPAPKPSPSKDAANRPHVVRSRTIARDFQFLAPHSSPPAHAHIITISYQ